MRLHGPISIGSRSYVAGDAISPLSIYPFFLIHMGAFGASGFFMAYAAYPEVPVGFLYMHGGIAIFVYLMFYLAIFGLDEVRWMFINAGLGLFGIASQINWLLSLFGRSVWDYPVYVHVVPFLYFILYTFLLRHALLDLFHARDDDTKRSRVNWAYVAGSLAVYAVTSFVEGG